MESVSLATIITSIGTLLVGFLSWVGDIFTFLIGNPLILFLILISIVPGIVVFAFKLIKRHRKI